MKKKLYNFVYRLMDIHSSVYVFLSGILVSLSTNMLTSLCFEKKENKGAWCIYLVIATAAVAGALLIYVATKLEAIHESFKRVLEVWKCDDVKNGDELQTKRKRKLYSELPRMFHWSVVYMVLVVSMVCSFVFTIIRYCLYC